jgi:CrcB protein
MIFVAVGGFFGAIARFWIGVLFNKVSFPFGTLFVNAVGAFLLGLLIGHGIEGKWLLLCGTGFLGAFTTFSTWMLETSKMKTIKAVFYIMLTCAAGFFGSWVGL